MGSLKLKDKVRVLDSETHCVVGTIVGINREDNTVLVFSNEPGENCTKWYHKSQLEVIV